MAQWVIMVPDAKSHDLGLIPVSHMVEENQLWIVLWFPCEYRGLCMSTYTHALKMNENLKSFNCEFL